MVLAAFAAVWLTGPCNFAAADDFQYLSYHVVAHGPTKALSDWTCWFGADRGCAYAPCGMKTVEEPKLGAMRPAVRDGHIPARGGACAGKPVPVMDILYTPKAGAHGSDEIILETHSQNGWAHKITITIDVP